MLERSDRFTPSPHPAVPPREYWLYDPDREGLLETPTDGNGFVDTEKLITLLLSKIDPSYEWSAKTNVHHLQWFAALYPSLPEAPVNPHRFRELNTNKVALPMDFHQWLHLMTERPDVPEGERMYEAILAQDIANELRGIVAFAKETAEGYGQDEVHRQKTLRQMLEASLEYFGSRLEKAKAMPKEFQLADYDSFELSSTQDMKRIARELGAASSVRTIHLGTRLTLPEAA